MPVSTRCRMDAPQLKPVVSALHIPGMPELSRYSGLQIRIAGKYAKSSLPDVLRPDLSQTPHVKLEKPFAVVGQHFELRLCPFHRFKFRLQNRRSLRARRLRILLIPTP